MPAHLSSPSDPIQFDRPTDRPIHTHPYGPPFTPHACRLEWLGVPPPYPEADQIALCVTAVASTLVLYFLLFGKRHRRRRKLLAKELREARRRVQELEEKLLEVGHACALVVVG